MNFNSYFHSNMINNEKKIIIINFIVVNNLAYDAENFIVLKDKHKIN
jgi:hypothetical protein